MRLLFVVQRYGESVAGGAEQACRSFAERLAARGHDVHAASSCATSYVDWANELPAGTTVENDVTVHRFPVDRLRRTGQFSFLNRAAAHSDSLVDPVVQRAWMDEQGPRARGLRPWLTGNAHRFDVVVFFTYLYYTTYHGLRAAAPLTTTVLHPTAHQEPYLEMPLFDEVFRLPDALALFTPEEGELIARRFRTPVPAEEIGIGLDPPVAPVDEATFRADIGVGDRPYVLFLGRVDPGKGSDELIRYFAEYKRRRESDLALVIVGDPVTRPDLSDDIIMTGYVDEATKSAALANAVALMQPSYFESFSLALVEAWQHSLPALVQGHTDVLVGQARRSGGAIPYWGYPEFEVALDRLLVDEDLRRALGANGKAYVEERYRWPVVLDRYEDLLARVVQRRRGVNGTQPGVADGQMSSITPRSNSASSG